MKKNLIFILIMGIFFSIAVPMFNTNAVKGDFLAYWSSAHLLVYGGNPFNPEEMRAVESPIDPTRFSASTGLISSWNPPWLFILLAPVGLLPYPVASIVWIFLNVMIIGLSLILAFKLCGGNPESRGMLMVFLAGFLFAGTAAYLVIGQITSLVLLAILGAIWGITHKQDYLAGFCLLVCTIKPHLTYFLILLIFIWMIRNRRWKILIGAIGSALVSMLVFWIVLPGWMSDYITLLHALPFTHLYTSTFGSFMAEVLQLPFFKYSAIILPFLIPPVYRLIDRFGWMTAANFSLLISIPLSPYGFYFDHILVLPAVVQMIYWISSQVFKLKYKIIVSLGLLVINLALIFILSINGLQIYWFFWIPLAVFALYLPVWITVKNYVPAAG